MFDELQLSRSRTGHSWRSKWHLSGDEMVNTVQVRIGKYSTSKSLYRGLATAVREHQPQLLTMAKKVTLDKVRGSKNSIHPEQQLVVAAFLHQRI